MVEGGLRFDALPAVDERTLPSLEHFRARDGAALPLRHFAADADCALILLHGSGHHGRYLAPLAARLAGASAARVLVPDLRGHGLALARRGDLDYADQLEDDLADLAAWVRARIPLIVPLSLLGALRIRALDGLTTVTFSMPDALRDGGETLAYSWRMTQGFAPRDFRRELAALRRPLLLLAGADDDAFFAERYAEVVHAHAPAAQVELLPGVTHLGIAGAPEAASRLAAWLAALR